MQVVPLELPPYPHTLDARLRMLADEVKAHNDEQHRYRSALTRVAIELGMSWDDPESVADAVVSLIRQR